MINRTMHRRVATILMLAIGMGLIAGGPYVRQDIATCCYALINELARVASPSGRPPALEAAIALIDVNPQEELSPARLSRECGVSSRTLSRLFREHLDISPVQYVIGRRLEIATVLLEVASMPIKEVAWRCGYRSESFFSRAFRKRYGTPPREFRRARGLS